MPKSIHRPEYEELRRLIREARGRAGVSQTELSAQLGRSQSFLSDIERGVRRVDLIELREMLALLGVDLVQFVRGLEAAIADRSRSGSTRRGAGKRAVPR